MKTVYFAHPVSHYDMDLERECIDVIYTMLSDCKNENSFLNRTLVDVEIFNPNQQWLQNLYKNRKRKGHKDPFSIFTEIANACDITVGVAFIDGTVGAGVAKEVDSAVQKGKDVYMIYFEPDGRKLFSKFEDIKNFRVLSIEETREKIKNGQV